MEKREIFLQKPEKLKFPKQYLIEELGADISVFSKSIQPIIEKIVNDSVITGKEQSMSDKEIHKWWHLKYGFPFDLKAAREELLMRKYSSPEMTKKAGLLQAELLQAIKGNNEEKIAELKKRYETEFPNQLEGVEIIFGLRDFISKQRAMTEAKKGGKLDYRKEKGRFQDLTEYQFLFTHFILQNSNDKEFLNNFWDVAEDIGDKSQGLKVLHVLHRGVITQVAAYKIFEVLGKQPKLSHPSEDAFNAVDLWVESDAIQIKGHDEEIPAVFEEDHVAFPAVQTQEGEGVDYWDTTYFKNQSARFQAKIKNYGKKINREIKGHMLVIPYSKIDFITGKPAPELVEFFRGEIEKPKTDNSEVAADN